MKAHVAPRKKETVKQLTELLLKEKIIGIVNMQNLPAAQLQIIKKSLYGKINLFMTKKRLMNHAIDEAVKKNKSLSILKEKLKGMPALLFTKENPFSLYKTLKKNKSPAPAKAGQEAPHDILIKKGPTSFAPGPVISELSALGLKPGVEGGKVAIKEDKIVVKEGEKISAPLASMLLRLGIKPMEIGLNLIAVYEEGTIYSKKVLDVDEDKLMEDIARIANEMFNLAIEINFPTNETIEQMLMLAHLQARTLSIEEGILADSTKGELLAKAESQANALKSRLHV